jgi:hypothetical protein
MRIGERSPISTPIPEQPSSPAPKPATGNGEMSPFSKLFYGLSGEMQKGESAMREAMSAVRAGRDLSGPQLLVLQSRVYRYSTAVDLSAKLIDRSTNGVKTVLQGQ